MRSATLALLLVLAAPPAAAAPPVGGLVVPGRGLGGLKLGAAPRAVLASWGSSYGVCRDCRNRTWYFNLVRYQPQGAGVEFRSGRVAALFTIWSPTGWHTSEGLHTGDPERRIDELYGLLSRRTCGLYDVLVLPRGSTRTQFYVYSGRVWGFGVSRASVPPCR
jgi:hypothetical protein